jgi:hypothetical protein
LVSQWVVARMIRVDYYTLMNEMRHLGTSWTRSTRGRSGRGHIRARCNVLDPDSHVEGSAEIMEEHGEYMCLVLVWVTTCRWKMSQHGEQNPMFSREAR